MNSSGSTEHSKHLSALSVAAFRRYLLCSILSTFGSWVVRFLLGWSAWELTYSAFWVGVVAALMLVPSFLLSPVFGVIADRINPRNGLVATIFLQALVALIGGMANLMGWFSLPWLLFMALLLGAISAAHAPIRLALIPLLVPRVALPSAVGFSAIVFNTSRILAPAAAAWLITQVSVANTFLSATVLLVAAIPFLVSVHRLTDPIARKTSTLSEQFLAGFTYAKEHVGIKLVFAYALLNALFGRTVIELLPALSGQLLSGGATTLATLTAMAGVGSIFAGLVMSRQRSDEDQILKLLTVCLLGGAVLLVPVIWLDGLSTVCLMIMSLSFFTTIAGTGTQILTQLLVADGFRGRVMSLWTVITMTGAALGVLVMGALADKFGFSKVLPGFSLFCIVSVAMLYFRSANTLIK